MNGTKFLTGNILYLLILLQSSALQINAQNDLLKPGKMDDTTFIRFQDMIKYNNPDSLIYYQPGKNIQPYMKFNFTYNDRHQPLVVDQYKMYDHSYRLEQRTIKTYDPHTATLRQTDLMVIDKVYKDSFSTRIENRFIYDSLGNVVLRYTVDTLDGVLMRSNGDSTVYIYDKNGMPLSAINYFFGFIGSDWILDRIYKVEDLNTDGNPMVITVSVINTEQEVIPIRQYRSIRWAKHCNSLAGIDTLANEYTLALFYDGKWEDSYKTINAFNALGKVDSSIVYTFKNGTLQPDKKDVYTYQGDLNIPTILQYEYKDGDWKLNTGTRRTFSFGVDGNNHYYLNVEEEIYEIPPGASSGNWKERDKVGVY